MSRPATPPRRSTSGPTSAPCRPPAWGPKPWSHCAGRRRAGEVRRRLRQRDTTQRRGISRRAGCAVRPLVVLGGPPGAGKTSVGRARAERRQVGFRNTDADVEASSGKTVGDIFVEDGEPVFRELERKAVAVALDE